ncbi:LamG-like jellyroll fold domain-containing protein [Marinoscillum furvescens]|uniref:LamG-like jellyroll fold domain-containing protein n=1 Tax=Marinoscillum furvescens TaxID=1026 RepID=UPI001C872182|nr:LamG-like jellyroll fold domain-containing protein [Marinoscillum furvescens]
MKGIFLTILCLLLAGHTAHSANQQRSLDELIILAAPHPQALLRDTAAVYNALVCTSDQLEEEVMDAIRQRLTQNHFVLVLQDSALQTLSLLRKHGLDTLLTSTEGTTLSTQPSLFVFSYGPDFLSITHHIWAVDHQGDSNPANDLALIHDNNDSTSLKYISTLLRRTGKLPNIIVSDSPEELLPLTDSLGQLELYTARVTENGQNLPEVSWAKIEGLTTSGKVHHWQQRVRPYKRGYRFSPDVLSFNAINSETTKRFIATRLSLEDNQILHLTFDNEAELHPAVYANVTFIDDPQRGTCVQFASTNHYIDFGQVIPQNLTELSLSVWIRPDSLSGNHSIVGVGEDFSIKIQEGRMCFTTPDILDHIAIHDSIPLKQWHHLAYVYTQKQELHFYLNGKLVDSQSASELESTAQSLLIGSNLWEESFSGKMDNLRIWNRALSTREVHELYHAPLPERTFNWWYLVLLVVVPVFWLLRKNKRPSVTYTPPPHDELQLQVFGQFRLSNLDGKELTHALSPQRLELFLVLLFHTLDKKGISTARLNDLLWEGYSSERAKNSRSTQVSKLRELLSQNTGINITYTNKRWRLALGAHTRCDLFMVTALLAKNNPRQDLSTLLPLVNSGPLLPNLQFEWLDAFKSSIHHDIIRYLTNAMSLYEDAAVLHQCCDVVFKIDPLNEPTLKRKLALHIEEGNHGLAKSTFDQFCRTYQAYYSEPFSHHYADFVGKVGH